MTPEERRFNNIAEFEKQLDAENLQKAVEDIE